MKNLAPPKRNEERDKLEVSMILSSLKHGRGNSVRSKNENTREPKLSKAMCITDDDSTNNKEITNNNKRQVSVFNDVNGSRFSSKSVSKVKKSKTSMNSFIMRGMTQLVQDENEFNTTPPLIEPNPSAKISNGVKVNKVKDEKRQATKSFITSGMMSSMYDSLDDYPTSQPRSAPAPPAPIILNENQFINNSYIPNSAEKVPPVILHTTSQQNKLVEYIPNNSQIVRRLNGNNTHGTNVIYNQNRQQIRTVLASQHQLTPHSATLKIVNNNTHTAVRPAVTVGNSRENVILMEPTLVTYPGTVNGGSYRICTDNASRNIPVSRIDVKQPHPQIQIVQKQNRLNKNMCMFF